MARVRRDLFIGKPDKTWYSQQQLVKKALLYPAAWLKRREVEIPAERYQAILEGILDTIKAKGNLDQVHYISRYLFHCVQQHIAHHGDTYYEEGKAIRNRVSLVMTSVERAHAGADGTVPVLDQAYNVLQLGRRKPKSKPLAEPLQPGLF